MNAEHLGRRQGARRSVPYLIWQAATSTPIVAVASGIVGGLASWVAPLSLRLVYGIGIFGGVFIGNAIPGRGHRS
jgi:hypothetical protein